MWWTGGSYRDLGAFSAQGSYGNRIHIIPGLNTVIVHTVNSNVRNARSVSGEELDRLLQMLMEARTGSGKDNPEVQQLG
jgi:CubicO group peptidase (beta-lactamase class C family)